MITAAHEQLPQGFSFRPAERVDGHHDIARFGWELVNAADGTAPVAGFDVITLDGEDRIRSVHGLPGPGADPVTLSASGSTGAESDEYFRLRWSLRHGHPPEAKAGVSTIGKEAGDSVTVRPGRASAAPVSARHCDVTVAPAAPTPVVRLKALLKALSDV